MKGKWKQNSKKKKGNEVLQKYMVAVGEFVKSKNDTEEAETDHGLRFVKKKSMKELRKEKRKMKKAKMKSHDEGKKTVSLPGGDDEKSGVGADQRVQKKKPDKTKKEVSKTHSTKLDPVEKPDKSKTLSLSEKGKKVNKLQESRKMALLEANEQEDREIKKLERYLGLNKRKNKKSLPQSFVADGLDYILGVIGSGSSAVGMYDDDDDMDTAKDNFEKLDEDNSQQSDEDEEAEDEVASEGRDDDGENEVDDDEEEEEEKEESSQEDEEMAEEEEEEEMEDDELNESDENEVEAEEEADGPETKTSCSKSEVVASATGKYVPPHLRDTGDDKRKAELEKLKRNVKGLVNR